MGSHAQAARSCWLWLQVSRTAAILEFLILVPLLLVLNLFATSESFCRVLKLNLRWNSMSPVCTSPTIKSRLLTWSFYFWLPWLSPAFSPADSAVLFPTWCLHHFRIAGAAQDWSGAKSLFKFHLCLVSEWLRLLPFLGVLALLGYLAVRPFLPKKKQQKDSLINLKIQKENPKVVNEINIEDLCLTKAYCRCWRSKTVRYLVAMSGWEAEICSIFISFEVVDGSKLACCFSLRVGQASENCVVLFSTINSPTCREKLINLVK